jgi:hypothetical protein
MNVRASFLIDRDIKREVEATASELGMLTADLLEKIVRENHAKYQGCE